MVKTSDTTRALMRANNAGGPAYSATLRDDWNVAARGTRGLRPHALPHSMMLQLFVCLIGLWLGSSALADGKVFPPHAEAVDVRIPDQRALLWWSNGVERLVIETRFTGQGTNFAWVVPLPSAPRVEPGTPGLFPTLLHLLRPQVIHTPTNGWLLGLFLGGALWLMMTVRADGRLRGSDWVAAAAVGGGCGSAERGLVAPLGVVLFGVVLIAVYRARHGRLKPLEAILLLIIPPLAAGFFLPTLATASTRGVGTSNPVEILDRQLAGVFETTTLTGRDPSALRDWLTTNGYRMPPETEPVIADYLREGWVFVASRVHRDATETNTASLHPLSFTFAAREPVYPLRLTGVGNGNLEVDLFVFGSERAAADGFRVLDCRRTQYPPGDLPSNPYWRLEQGPLPMAHEGLRTAAPESDYVTRLQGTLTPSQMRRDAVVRWDGFAEVQDVRYSLQGAWMSVANWTVNGLCLFMVGLAAFTRSRSPSPRTLAKAALTAVLSAVAVTGLGVAMLPIVPVTLERRFATQNDALNQQYAVRFAILDEQATNAPVTLTSVREAIRRGLPFHLGQIGRRRSNFRIREEDSPFNYSLRSRSNGVDLLLYDPIGRVEVIPIPK